MCGNNTLAKNQRLPRNASSGQVPKWDENKKAWIASDEAGTGINAYLYIAYADDENGSGFTTNFNASKNFVAIKNSANPTPPIQNEFAGLWFNYKGIKGDNGNNGVNGVNGVNGQNAFVYIGYADDANGTGFSPFFNASKNFIAIRSSTVALTPILPIFNGLWFNYKGQQGNIGVTGNNGTNGNDGADGKDGQSAFVYIGYADDDSGNGFSPGFDPNKRYIAIRKTTWVLDGQNPETFMGYWVKYKGDDGINGNDGANGVNGANGQNAFVYIGYADDAGGAGYTPVFNAGKNYIAIKASTVALTPIQTTFAGLWFNYKGQTGNVGATGNNGQSAYVYIAYADNNVGTGFTTVFGSAKNYIAIKNSIIPLTPIQSDFNGLWFNYKGQTGQNGSNGINGSDGANAYVYIGYADALDGTGFTPTFDPNKDYIALYQTNSESEINQSTFDGLWVRYKWGNNTGISQDSIVRNTLDEDVSITPLNGHIYFYSPSIYDRNVYLQSPPTTVRFLIKNTANQGDGRLLIYSPVGPLLKSLTAGLTVDLIYDSTEGIWELIEL